MKNAHMSGALVGETVIGFLWGAVERYGSRDALLFKPAFRYQRWSYSRLWNESGQVATLLQRRGLTKGDQVILWGPNSPHWVLVFFGCIRAGVILVPLDLRSAHDYIARVVSRTDPKLAFTSRSTPKGDVNLGVPEITFEELETAIQDLPQPEHVDIEPDDLAEIMFTSGTTGDPKGVMEEAVEICKLRLFLKLVAQLESYDQIEPLPDIDFNVRAGNTLVGFTALDAVRQAMTVMPNGQHRQVFPEDQAALDRINEEAEIALYGLLRSAK